MKAGFVSLGIIGVWTLIAGFVLGTETVLTMISGQFLTFQAFIKAGAALGSGMTGADILHKLAISK